MTNKFNNEIARTLIFVMENFLTTNIKYHDNLIYHDYKE